MKLSQFSQQSQAVIRRIAKASNMSPEKVLRVIEKSSNAQKVNIHLNYGL